MHFKGFILRGGRLAWQASMISHDTQNLEKGIDLISS
jgi:hypothetical protein